MKFEIRNLKFLLPVIAGFLLATPAFAADVRMTVEKPLISLLDRTVLRIEFIDTKGDAVELPEIEGLKIQYQGQSSETRIVNFKSSTKIIHNYLITPSKVGDYTIGPVTARFKGGEKELATKLRVVKPQDDREAQELSELMYAQISTDRESPYVHEPFNVEIKVFIRDGIQILERFGIQGKLPDSGLEGQLDWNVFKGSREEINGAIFNTYFLRTRTKTLTAGTFTFRPDVQVNVVVPRQRRRSFGFDDPFFGDMFGRQETRPFLLDCNRLDIPVRPIPMEGRPESFSGGVGLFDFNVDVAPRKVQAGEPITVKMRIAGLGNISKVTPPAIEPHHDIKLYEVRAAPSKQANEVRFEQVIIPKSDSVTNLPAIAFSYFNTKTADFRTITRGPFPVTVEAGAQQAAQVIATAPSAIQQATKVLGRDIVYLKPMPKIWKKRDHTAWYRKPSFPVLLALPGLVLALSAGFAMRRNTLANDVALARRQKAPRAARKHVQRAEQACRNHDESGFYEVLWDALADYFGHRLNLAPGEVTLQAVLARFPSQSEALEVLFNVVEQRRYGIRSGETGSTAEMKVLIRQLSTTLKKCERAKR